MLSPGPIVEQIFRGDKSSVRKTAGVTKIIKPAGEPSGQLVRHAAGT
jgi:hypothetical protein